MTPMRHLCVVLAVSATALQYPSAFAERFEANTAYLCVTDTALFASPKTEQHGEWTDPPRRFQINIEACETFCLPQKSKDPPLSLFLQEPTTEWPIKYEGYRGQADYHAATGGSVVLSSDDLTLTRSMIGSLPGATQHVALVLEAKCHPID